MSTRAQDIPQQPSDDLAGAYLARQKDKQENDAFSAMMQAATAPAAGSTPGKTGDSTGVKPGGPGDGALATVGRDALAVGKDIGSGLIEGVPVAARGVRNAFANLFNAGDELAGWMNGRVMQLDEHGLHWLSEDEAKQRGVSSGVQFWKGPTPTNLAATPEGAQKYRSGDLIPNVGHESTTVTGGLIEGVAQFVTGMVGAGRLIEGAGTLANTAKGAASMFTAFDPHAARLSNLVQEYPALQNPVTEWLAAKPGDNAALGRLKNALEGMGLGGLTEGFIKGLNVVRSGLIAERAAGGAKGEGLTPDEVREVLGKPRELPEDAFKNLEGGDVKPPPADDSVPPITIPRAPTEPKDVENALARHEAMQRTGADRLADPALRDELERMKDETGWAQEGGHILREGAQTPGGLVGEGQGEVTGRTEWIPRADWWPDRPHGLSEEETHTAIDKALAGEKLGSRQQAMVNYLLDTAEQNRYRTTGARESGGEQSIRNPIDVNATPEEKLDQLKALTRENTPAVDAMVKDLNESIPGTESKRSIKADDRILEKASRPSILDEKPWYGVEHIRDALRFKTVLNSLDDLPSVLDVLKRHGVDVVKVDTGKLTDPGPWGWRFVGLDLRMPNGQLVEHYMPLQELEAAKKDNHVLYEKWRNRDPKELTPEEFQAMKRDMEQSRSTYQAAWDSALERTNFFGNDARASADSFAEAASSLTKENASRSETLSGADSRQTPLTRSAAKPGSSTSTEPPSDTSTIGTTSSGSIPKTTINFARIDAPEDVKAVMQTLSDKGSVAPDSSRAGVRSFEQTSLDAAHLNAWDTLLNRREGAPLSDSESVAARELWVSTTDKLVEIANQAAAEPSEANLFAFRKMLDVHDMVQREVLGARASTARALASWKIPVGSSAERLKNVQAALEATGGSEVAQDLAHRVAALAGAGRLDQMGTLVEKGAWATTRDAIKDAWTLGLLTNPMTHMRNILSNSLAIPTNIAERKVASWFSWLRGASDGVEPGEALAQYHGTTQGLRDLWRYYRNSSTLPNPIEETGMSGSERVQDVVGQGGGDNMLARGARALGSVYGISAKAMGAEDEFFKVLGYRGEIHARSYRQAVQEAASGKIDESEIPQRMAELVADPPEDIKQAGVDQALYQTFNQAPGDFGKMLLKAKRNYTLAHILIPFARTTANLAREAFERSPAAPLVGQWRADIAAGGARADLAKARMALGSLAMLTVIDATMRGDVSGRGPVDPGTRQALARDQGWQPYSIKVGSRWYSYNGVSPIGDVIGMAADVAEVALHGEDALVDGKEIESVTTAAIAAAAGNVMNKSFLSGFADAVGALDDPHGAEKWAQGMAGSFIPGISTMATHALDPNIREVNTMVDSIKSRLPGLSETLPVKRDLWGEPMTRTSGFGRVFDALSPVYTREGDRQPIDEEILRLKASIPMPNPVAEFKGVPVDLRKYPKAYERYVELAGNALKADQYGAPVTAFGQGARDYLNAIVTGKSPLSFIYQMKSDGPDGAKDTFIKATLAKYREAARGELLKEFPELRADVEQKQFRKSQLKMPQLDSAAGAQRATPPKIQ